MLASGFQKMTNFNKISLVLAIFFVLFIAVSMCYRKSNKPEYFQSEEDSLYFFNVDWCGHCKTAKPEWGKFISMASSNKGLSRVKFVDANGDDKKNSQLLEKFGVNAYPMFVLQKGGESIEYKGDRTSDGLMKFVKDNYP